MSGFISVEGQGHDEYGARYFQISTDNAEIVVSAKTVISEPSRLYELLTNAGTNCITAKAKKAVLDEIDSFQGSGGEFRVATKVGFFHRQFILPGQIIGMSSPPTCVVLDDLDQSSLQKYREKGTLQQWQTQIAGVAVGNTRMMFSIAVGFTGPILPFVQGPRTGGFQLVGPPANGKTTAAKLSGSVWGCHVGDRQEAGFTESWHSTGNQLERNALAHNNTVYLPDETRLAGSDEKTRILTISKSIMALAQGVEKDRMTNTAPHRSVQAYILSTSNLTLSQLARAGKIEIDDAYYSRLFDIPCPEGTGHGIYEILHGFASGEEMSDALQRRSRTYFGTAGPAFVRELVAERNRGTKALRRRIEQYRSQYREKAQAAITREGLKSLGRVMGRCATTYAAGRLAIEYGVLPWKPADLGRAILSCHLAGLHLHAAQVSQSEPSEAELRRRLIAHLAAGRGFMDLRRRHPAKGSTAAAQAPAFFGTGKEAGWFYLRKSAVDALLGTGQAAEELLRRLRREDHLAQAKQGGFVVQRRIYSGGKGNQNLAWVCAFSPALTSSA